MTNRERFDALSPARQRETVASYRRAILHMARAFDSMRDIEYVMGCDYDGMIEQITHDAAGAPLRGALTLSALADIDADALIGTLDACTTEDEHDENYMVPTVPR